jgi:hypothetical protein
MQTYSDIAVVYPLDISHPPEIVAAFAGNPYWGRKINERFWGYVYYHDIS